MVSADGRYALTVIAFLGSVFSPTYAGASAAAASPGERPDPLAHCALNVALESPEGTAWVQCEGLPATRTADRLMLGDSVISAWPGGLEIDLRVPVTRFFGRPGEMLEGRVTLHPAFTDGAGLLLAPGQPWHPVVPRGHAQVSLTRGGGAPIRFEGAAYHDANLGDAPLAQAFRRWAWARWPTAEGGARVAYRGERADGGRFDVSLAWDAAGRRRTLDPGAWRLLWPTGWGLSRPAPAEALTEADGLPRTLLDAPFYVRTLLPGGGVNESVDLLRFNTKWVRHLLGYRTHRLTR